MIGNCFQCGGDASSAVERRLSAGTLALQRSSQYRNWETKCKKYREKYCVPWGWSKFILI